MESRRRQANCLDDVVSRELADLPAARDAVDAVAIALLPAGRHLSRIRRLVPSRTRLALWCAWAGESDADVAAAAFRAPIRVAADIAHAIRRIYPDSPGPLALAVAVLEWCGMVLDRKSITMLAMFSHHCRYPKPV